MPETNFEARAYILGGELKALRRRAGLSQRRLAEMMGLASHTVFVRWEHGERVPDETSIELFARALRLPAVDRKHLIQLAREVADEPVNEVSAGTHGQADALTTLVELERSAVAITDVSPLLVPGLLQTTDYARIVLGRAPDVETKAAIRVGRRDVITRDRDPARYTAYILDSVLRQEVGRDVLLDQLRLIRKLVELPNVCVRVIPAACGITRAHMGSFVLLEFARAEPVVHLEHISTTAFLRDRSDVRTHMTARTDLDGVAMSPVDSVGLIDEVIEELERKA